MKMFADRLRRVPKSQLDLGTCASVRRYGFGVPVGVPLKHQPSRSQAAVSGLEHLEMPTIAKAAATDRVTPVIVIHAFLLTDLSSVNRLLDVCCQPMHPAVRCYLSHVAIWCAFLDSGEPWIFFFEEDAGSIVNHSTEICPRTIALVPVDAGTLLFGGTIMDGLAEPGPHPSSNRVYYFNGTFAYLLTRKGAQSLLPRLLPIKTHIDNQISLELVACPAGTRACCCELWLFAQDVGDFYDDFVPVAYSERSDRALALVITQGRQ